MICQGYSIIDDNLQFKKPLLISGFFYIHLVTFLDERYVLGKLYFLNECALKDFDLTAYSLKAGSLMSHMLL